MAPTLTDEAYRSQSMPWIALLFSSAAVGLGYVVTTTTRCDDDATAPRHADAHLTPSDVGKENFLDTVNAHDVDSMPVYTSDQVAANNGDDGTPVWMTYGGVVYDVTDFIANHPGGSEKILQAAGSAIEPYWCV